MFGYSIYHWNAINLSWVTLFFVAILLVDIRTFIGNYIYLCMTIFPLCLHYYVCYAISLSRVNGCYHSVESCSNNYSGINKTRPFNGENTDWSTAFTANSEYLYYFYRFSIWLLDIFHFAFLSYDIWMFHFDKKGDIIFQSWNLFLGG